MSKAHRLAKGKTDYPKPFPLNFLLGCSEASLAEFETAKLAQMADRRREMQELLDRTMEAMNQAALASWFRSQDRNALKHAIENEETPEEWAHRMMRDGQRSAEELVPRPALEPGAAHLAAASRYQERNIAAGKCQNCPQPLDPNSVRYCTKHLAAERHKYQKKGKAAPGSREYLYSEELQPSTHGRQPGTLASLAMHREKKSRALLAELGIPPESAAVSFKAAKEALLRVMPNSKANAMTAYDLFQKAQIPTDAGRSRRSSTTGAKALRELLAEGLIQKTGKGVFHDPVQYWATAQIERPKEPRKRIRAIYIPEQVRSARVPLSKKQKELQKHAREVAEASRFKGEPKYY